MPYVIAIHGGSGTITRSEITSKQKKAYRYVLEQALDVSYTPDQKMLNWPEPSGSGQ